MFIHAFEIKLCRIHLLRIWCSCCFLGELYFGVVMRSSMSRMQEVDGSRFILEPGICDMCECS